MFESMNFLFPRWDMLVHVSSSTFENKSHPESCWYWIRQISSLPGGWSAPNGGWLEGNPSKMFLIQVRKYTLPETNRPTSIAPENGWLEYVEILISFWNGPFSGAILVYQSVVICPDLGIIDFVGLSQDALVPPTKDEEICMYIYIYSKMNPLKMLSRSTYS